MTGRRTNNRRGAAILVVIAVFACVLMMLAGWTRSVLDADRQARLDRQAVQVRLLAEAGLARAAARLRAGDEYTGETWHIAAQEIGLPRDAEVLITVADAQLTAVASYPAGDSPTIRRTRTLDPEP